MNFRLDILYMFYKCFRQVNDSYKKLTFQEFRLNIALLNYISRDINICPINLSKLEFITLDISGKNYLLQILVVEIHHESMNFGGNIKDGNQNSLQNRLKAMIYIHYHLHEELKIEYLKIKDLNDLIE